jgi:hypothetical protein
LGFELIVWGKPSPFVFILPSSLKILPTNQPFSF